MNVVVRAGERLVSLVVDEIPTCSTRPVAFERPPSTVEGVGGALFSAPTSSSAGCSCSSMSTRRSCRRRPRLNKPNNTWRPVQ